MMEDIEKQPLNRMPDEQLVVMGQPILDKQNYPLLRPSDTQATYNYLTPVENLNSGPDTYTGSMI